MPVAIINSRPSLESTLNDLRAAFESKKYVRVSYKFGRDRSLDQNALSHAWYEQIGQATGDTAEAVKRRCKMLYGVPILRADCADFSAWCMAALDPLGYENRIEAMKWVDITSLMTLDQMTRYLTAVQVAHAQAGIVLQGSA